MSSQLSAISRQISSEFSTTKFKINNIEKKIEDLEIKMDLMLTILNKIKIPPNPFTGARRLHGNEPNALVTSSLLPPPPTPL